MARRAMAHRSSYRYGPLGHVTVSAKGKDELLRRQWYLSLTCVGAGLLVAAACGQPMGNISDQPHDLSSGRALARAVTHKTGCGYIEDASLEAADHWDFTCQTGADLTFVIHTANSEAARDAGRPDGLPFKTGPFYIVSPTQKSSDKVLPPAGADAPKASSLRAFPGKAFNADGSPA